MTASPSNPPVDVSTRFGYPEYPESRPALTAILNVGIDNILDKEIQPRERLDKRHHARVDAHDTRILTPEEYWPHLLSHLGRLMRQCDDPAQIKLLLRQQVETRQADGRIRARVRLGREVQPHDVKAVLNNLNELNRENDALGSEGAVEDTMPRRKRPAESLMGLDDGERSCAKTLRLDRPVQSGELDGVGWVKQEEEHEEEQGVDQYVKQEEEQDCGLQYVLEYAPGGQDVDQGRIELEDIKQEDIKHEEEHGYDQNVHDPQDGEPSARASKKTQKGKTHRAGRQRTEQKQRRERRAEYARRTADILGAYPRLDTLSKDFESTDESAWIRRLLEAKLHRLGEIKRLLAFSEPDREPEAAKLAAHLTASSALGEATRNLEGKTKFEFLAHHVLDMQDDRTHLAHKAVVLETSIRKLYGFTKEKGYRLLEDVEAGVLAALA